MEWMDTVNRYSGILTLLFSALVSLSTVVYAVLTARLVRETRKMRQIQIQPKVSIIVRPRDEWINAMDLYVTNIGQGPAYDVHFAPSEDFEHHRGQHLSDISILKNGIDYMPPGHEIKTYLTSMVEDLEKKKDKRFTIRVTYRSLQRKSFSDDYVIDFSQYLGIIQLGSPPLHKISESLEQINHDLRSAIGGFGKLRVQLVNEEPSLPDVRAVGRLRRQNNRRTRF